MNDTMVKLVLLGVGVFGGTVLGVIWDRWRWGFFEPDMDDVSDELSDFGEITHPEPVPDDGEIITVAPGEAVESVYHILVPGLNGRANLDGAGMRMIDAGDARVMMLTPVVDADGVHVKVIVNRPA